MKTVKPVIVLCSSALVCFNACCVLGAEFMYWTERAENVIRRARLDGSGVETILTAADGVDGPRGISVDPVKGWMYWTQREQILRATLSGGSVETLLTVSDGSMWGIEFDVTGRKVLFTDSRLDRIGQMNSDGTSPIYLITTGQRNPIGIDLDYSLGKIYWIHAPVRDVPNGVRRANRNGSRIETVVENQAWPLDLVVDRPTRKIYFTDQNLHTVKSVNLDGSDETTLASGLQAPFGIDIHDDQLYWVDHEANTLQRVNTDGTGLTTILSGLGEPNGIAIVNVVPEPSNLTLLVVGIFAVLLRTDRAVQSRRTSSLPAGSIGSPPA